jgi:hypothetical protein
LSTPRTGSRERECALPKKPSKIEIVQEGDTRFVLTAFADGSEERKPIVKLPKKTRYPPRTYRKLDFSRKKGF